MSRYANTCPAIGPFIRYYGGKWRAAPRYDAPKFPTIVEPFAGAAGYACRYWDRDVILVEKYAVLAEMWRFLIGESPDVIRRLPEVEHVDDLPSWVPEGGRILVGFAMNSATVAPRKRLSVGRKKLRARGRVFEGWSRAQRERVASGAAKIKHWRIIESDYSSAPPIKATWFIDPPYSTPAGRYYIHSNIDYHSLADWCRDQKGQVIVCEQSGANWLPFQEFGAVKSWLGGSHSSEVVWRNERD